MKGMKTIEVETNSDTQMRLHICECHIENEYGISKPFYELCISLKKETGEEGDGTQITTLNGSQILRLVGQLLTARAELEVKNKNINK